MTLLLPLLLLLLNGIGRATLTVQETAARLGIGRNAAYEAIRRGELPAVRIGRRLLVPEAALSKWLEHGGGAAPRTLDDAARNEVAAQDGASS